MTPVHDYKNLTIIEGFMRSALLRKLERIDDYHEITELNRNLWANKNATELFDKLEDGFAFFCCS